MTGLREAAAMHRGWEASNLDSQTDASTPISIPGEKKVVATRDQAKSALEGRGACVELRRGVAITEVMLWWGGPNKEIGELSSRYAATKGAIRRCFALPGAGVSAVPAAVTRSGVDGYKMDCAAA